MIRSEKSIWFTIIAVEVVFVVLTRIALARYSTYSQEAELIRTLFRLGSVLIYWHLLRDYITSKSLVTADISQSPLLLAFALFLSVPLLVGDLSYMGPGTKAVFAATSIVVGLKEEVTFRALIQNLIAKRFGNLTAIIVTTVLFTAYHIGAIPMSIFAYGQVVLASLLLGILYARTQNLLLVIWLHAIYDALWSLTPIATGALLPYRSGLLLLVVSVLLVFIWGRPSIWPNPAFERDCAKARSPSI